MKSESIIFPIIGSLSLLALRLWIDRIAAAKGQNDTLSNKTKVAFASHYTPKYARYINLTIFVLKSYIARYCAVAFLLWSVTWVFAHGVPLFNNSNVIHNIFFSIAAFILPSIIVALWDAPLGMILSPLFGFIEMFLYAGYMLSGIAGVLVTGVILTILLIMMLNGPELSVGSPRWSWWFWYIRKHH